MKTMPGARTHRLWLALATATAPASMRTGEGNPPDLLPFERPPALSGLTKRSYRAAPPCEPGNRSSAV